MRVIARVRLSGVVMRARVVPALRATVGAARVEPRVVATVRSAVGSELVAVGR
jgi:hypothetical protein